MPLAGLAYFLGGFALLGYSVGLERDDLNRLIERSRRLSRRRGALVPEWLGQYFAKAAVSFEPVAPARESQTSALCHRRRRILRLAPRAFLPGPAAFERPNHVVQAAFAQAIATRKGADSYHPLMTTSLAVAMSTSMTAPTPKVAPSPGVSHRPTSSARPSEPQVIETPIDEPAPQAKPKRGKPVRRPRAGARRCHLPAAVAQPVAPPGRNQVRPDLHADRAARHRAPARGRARRFRHQGRGARDQARPRRHAVRARAGARHQVVARRSRSPTTSRAR